MMAEVPPGVYEGPKVANRSMQLKVSCGRERARDYGDIGSVKCHTVIS